MLSFNSYYWYPHSFMQSWYERFLGTLEGFGCCQYYKWNWWHNSVQILRLWYCWGCMGYIGIPSMPNKLICIML